MKHSINNLLINLHKKVVELKSDIENNFTVNQFKKKIGDSLGDITHKACKELIRVSDYLCSNVGTKDPLGFT